VTFVYDVEYVIFSKFSILYYFAVLILQLLKRSLLLLFWIIKSNQTDYFVVRLKVD